MKSSKLKAQSSKGKSPIIILHGWGLYGDRYNDLSTLLRKKGYDVYAPDLPGFGNEPLRNTSMNLDDYVLFVRTLMKKKRIKKPVLIGHSFGGRIALKFAHTCPSEAGKVVLTGVPLTRDRSFRKNVWFDVAVVGRTVLSVFPASVKEFFRKLLYLMVGEWDYYKAGPLKQVFQNIVSEEVLPYLREISVPVLIVWGKKDVLTPLSELRKALRHLSHFHPIVVDGTGHKLPYEKPEVFVSAIRNFLR